MRAKKKAVPEKLDPKLNGGYHFSDTELAKFQLMLEYFRIPIPNPRLLTFTTSNARNLQFEFRTYSDRIELAKWRHGYFPNGDPDLEISSSLKYRDVLIVSSMLNDDFRELLEMLSTIATQGEPRSISVVITYYGGQTMERRAPSHVQLTTAPQRADLLSRLASSLPVRVKFFLCDLHVSSIEGMFHDVFAQEVWLMPIVQEVCAELRTEANLALLDASDLVIAFPDAGRASWVESIAIKSGLNTAGILKKRFGPGNTETRFSVGDVANCVVLVSDDIFRTGGTIRQAIARFMSAGAKGVYVMCSHWECTSLDAMRNLVSTPGFLGAYTTNTHPRARYIAAHAEFRNHLQVRSIVPLLMRTVLAP